jgi:hypothetical protein
MKLAIYQRILVTIAILSTFLGCRTTSNTNEANSELTGIRADVRINLKDKCGRRNTTCVYRYYNDWIADARGSTLSPTDIDRLKQVCAIFQNFSGDPNLGRTCNADLEGLRRDKIDDTQSQLEDQLRQPGGELSMFQDHRSGFFGPNYSGRKIFMLVVGGWNSCVTGQMEGEQSFMGKSGLESPWDGRTTKGFKPFYNRMRETDSDVKIYFMLVCLQTGPANKAQMRFITSDKLAVLHQTKDGRTPYRTEDLPDLVAQYFPDTAIPTYVVGHSYGGWVVMNYIRDIARQGRNIKGLFTLDPISSLQCPPLAQILKSPACTFAPGTISGSPDIPNQEIINSLPRDGVWYNFFQNNGGLHSSAIPQLQSFGRNIDRTEKFDGNSAAATEAAHRNMGLLEDNWDIIYERIIESM